MLAGSVNTNWVENVFDALGTTLDLGGDVEVVVWLRDVVWGNVWLAWVVDLAGVDGDLGGVEVAEAAWATVLFGEKLC